jgi:RNA polymerase sigma-70 factor (ECF subfamily)
VAAHPARARRVARYRVESRRGHDLRSTVVSEADTTGRATTERPTTVMPAKDRTSLVRQELSGQLARLWRYGMVVSGRRDIAEDLVQATCLRALERAEQFQPGSRIDRWLLSILHSIWLNDVRANRIRTGQGFVDAETELTTDGADIAESQVLANEMVRRVQKLPEAQRATVFLAYVEEMTYRETADILGIPIGTVMSRLAAARATLAATQSEGGKK